MMIRNEIESFIEGIYAGGRRSLSREKILGLAREILNPPTMVELFGFLPDGAFTEEGLVDAVNAIIKERQIEDLTGGLVRMPAKT